MSHGPELVPEPSDDVTFMVYGQDEAEQLVVDPLVGRIQVVRDDTFDIEVLGNLTKQGLGVPHVGHGYMAGDVMSLDRRAAISIIKPAPPVMAKSRLAAKSRHKRYRVQVGELIELRPDTIPSCRLTRLGNRRGRASRGVWSSRTSRAASSRSMARPAR